MHWEATESVWKLLMAKGTIATTTLIIVSPRLNCHNELKVNHCRNINLSINEVEYTTTHNQNMWSMPTLIGASQHRAVQRKKVDIILYLVICNQWPMRGRCMDPSSRAHRSIHYASTKLTKLSESGPMLSPWGLASEAQLKGYRPQNWTNMNVRVTGR